MLIFHFVNEEFGLENLRRRRLKIATLHELNDPFEFFAVSLGDEALRHAFGTMKDEMAKTRGMLCFSRSWDNPVQWSHYADRHRGVCLGFDIPDEHLQAVTYSSKRLIVTRDKFVAPRELMDEALAVKVLFTKYAHWKYENEVRCFLTLEDIDPEKHLYFADFSDRLKLVEVIVGARATVSRAQIADALGELSPNVTVKKARIAFRSFKVVRQRNEKLWT